METSHDSVCLQSYCSLFRSQTLNFHCFEIRKTEICLKINFKQRTPGFVLAHSSPICCWPTDQPRWPADLLVGQQVDLLANEGMFINGSI